MFTVKETETALVSTLKRQGKIGPRLVAQAVLCFNSGASRNQVKNLFLEHAFTSGDVYLSIANKVCDRLKAIVPGDASLKQATEILETRIIELMRASRDDGQGTLNTWQAQLRTGQVQCANAKKDEQGNVSDVPAQTGDAGEAEAPAKPKQAPTATLKQVMAFLANASFEDALKVATACQKRILTFKPEADTAKTG